jgi:hypothetical protein
MLPPISFETGRKTQTQSSVKTTRWSETANGSLVLIETTAERPTPAAKNPKELHLRSSEARRESLCPLDKDLSWKSDYRTCGFADRHLSE